METNVADSDSRDDDEDIESAATFSPEYDQQVDTALAEPVDVSNLYLQEASPYRPIATGDIFVDVSVPGGPNDGAELPLTMLVAHPCAMRKGPLIEPRAKAAAVVPANGVRKSKWTNGHFDFFPLPNLRAVAEANGWQIDNRGWGASLADVAPIATQQLTIDTRIACLSPEGIRLLLQRLVHCDTRVAVKPKVIEDTYRPNAEEIELLESWNLDLASARVERGEALDNALYAEAHEFDAFVGAGSPSPRHFLRSDDRVAEGRRLVSLEIRRRRSAGA